MDTARQVFRFGIPGAIGLAWALAWFVGVRHGSGEDIGSALGAIRDNVSPAIAILGSIPAGWLAYQVYYFLYRPWILGGRLMRRDRGAEVLGQLTRAQMNEVCAIFPDAELTVPMSVAYGRSDQVDERAQGRRWAPRRVWRRIRRRLGVLRLLSAPETSLWKRAPRELRVSYAHEWRVHWEVVRALLDFAADNGSERTMREFEMLSDAYHGTGCARYALYGGWLAGASAGMLQLAGRDVSLAEPALWCGAGLLATIAIGVFPLHHARRVAWKRMVSTLGKGLRLFFAARPELLRDLAAQVRRDGEQPPTARFVPPPEPTDPPQEG